MTITQQTPATTPSSPYDGAPPTNTFLADWIQQVTHQVQPERVVWCDGSETEYHQLITEMSARDELTPLNQESYPGCYLYRSHINDVARSEHLTFICTTDKTTVGPNNNWLPPEQGHARVDTLLEGAMKGRTMYVVPYCLGAMDSPYAQFGIEITDSPYVVINMKIMTRMGRLAYNQINELSHQFVRGLHCTLDLSPERRWVMHFPDEMMIKSVGSGYGGNALLGKKCHGLRLASYQAQQQGWLAEHMLIVGIENPAGEKTYIAAAFPSACGKTNLAMLIPPSAYKGWKVWTVGDDIAWLRPGQDGRLYAINPENGFFGVVPGTSNQTNPHATQMIKHNTIFTNVGLTANQEPWWEGKNDGTTPATTWKNTPYDGSEPAAHPNARFTVGCTECPSYEVAPPEGVPISAILFGSRRAQLVPLVFQTKNWLEGVLAGAVMSSETTAAATGKVGVLRHDPMAMKPFCGYNYGNYWSHWLSIGEKLTDPPKIFHVNWFRQDDQGHYLWPGFGENIRVLEWIIARATAQLNTAQTTPLGYLPHTNDLNLSGLNSTEQQLKSLLHVDNHAYSQHLQVALTYLNSFAPQTPSSLLQCCQDIIEQMNAHAT